LNLVIRIRTEYERKGDQEKEWGWGGGRNGG